jgi:hypothetical protein
LTGRSTIVRAITLLKSKTISNELVSIELSKLWDEGCGGTIKVRHFILMLNSVGATKCLSIRKD